MGMMTPKKIRFLFLTMLAFIAMPTVQAQQTAIAIHGGAGTILRQNMTPESEAEYRQKLEEALRIGHDVLEAGGTSLDAVVAAIQVLEASPLFNAGVGAVFTSEGTVELDASIMEGRDRNAGAVAGVKRVRSPIELARRVMEQSPHVLMAREGAEAFAQEQGLPLVENDYFHTERRRRQLQRIQEANDPTPSGGSAPREDGANPPPEAGAGAEEGPLYKRWGTVGAVALDRSGTLAAGTSTGGMTNKRFGRIGDSPIIGAGTYADNATCAVSATGHGEYFIRGVVAYDIAAMMRYAGLGLHEAANAVIHGRLAPMGGTGGVIAMDAEGNIAMPFNTEGMYRGYIDTEGTLVVEIYGD